MELANIYSSNITKYLPPSDAEGYRLHALISAVQKEFAIDLEVWHFESLAVPPQPSSPSAEIHDV